MNSEPKRLMIVLKNFVCYMNPVSVSKVVKFYFAVLLIKDFVNQHKWSNALWLLPHVTT